MLASYVVRLALQRSVPRSDLPRDLGRQLVGMLLSDAIGDSGVLSGIDVRWAGLVGPTAVYQRKRYLLAGTHWVRIVVLNPRLFVNVNNALNHHVSCGSVFPVQKARFKAIEVVASPVASAWAAISSYDRLITEAGEHKEFSLLFRGVLLADDVPIACQVGPSAALNYYRRSWANFSELPASPAVLEQMEASVLVCGQKLRARQFEAGNGSSRMRLNGWLRLRLHADDPLVLRTANALADYAFFCGTFTDANFGMGMTRKALA